MHPQGGKEQGYDGDVEVESGVSVYREYWSTRF